MIRYISYNDRVSQEILMHLIGVLMLSLAGMGLVAGMSAALYAALPRSFLDYAELHGRFHGMRQEQLSP
jgi:hypothetical protein